MLTATAVIDEEDEGPVGVDEEKHSGSDTDSDIDPDEEGA